MNEPVRILCVDDEVNVLKALERTFMDDEYEIIKASTGDEGLEILRNVSPIQLVIADYRMPEMTGVDFLRAVRSDWPETVRIVLSGYADAATIVAAINEGQIYKFIPKPWNADELKVTIENALERYYLNKRNRELTEQLREKNDELNKVNSNLEKIISENTAEIMLQNRILLQAQTILHNLPIGVVAVNSDGILIQCNVEAERIMSCGDIECPGTPLRSILTLELNGIRESGGSADGVVPGFTLNGSAVRMKSRMLEGADGTFTVLVIDRDI
ncbi:MAG: response regulator [Deltaproteobacteria bacterium]|nr:response regulator [Deltaproteobacteria bacterium]